MKFLRSKASTCSSSDLAICRSRWGIRRASLLARVVRSLCSISWTRPWDASAVAGKFAGTLVVREDVGHLVEAGAQLLYYHADPFVNDGVKMMLSLSAPPATRSERVSA